MNIQHTTRAIYCTQESMRNSFDIDDQGVLNIYDDHIFYKGHSSEISIERSRIVSLDIINKAVGIFEFIQIIVVNLIVVSGYLSYQYKNLWLLTLLILVTNFVLYFPIFKEKWLKLIYLEAGENKVAYFKPLGILNLFSSWGINTNDCETMYKLLKK